MGKTWQVAWAGLSGGCRAGPPLQPSIRPWLRICAAAVVLIALLQALGNALQLPAQSGDGFLPSTLQFQVTWDADLRARILAFWQVGPAMRWIAGLALLADALLFVPVYLLAIAGAAQLLHWVCSLAGVSSVWAERLRRLALAAASGAALADQAENLQSLAWLLLGAPMPAWAHPVLATSAWLKWVLLGLCLATLLALAGLWWHALGWQRCKGALHAAALAAVHAVRFVFLHVFALAALVLGIVLMGFVPQTQDILTSLGLDAADAPAANDMRLTNLFWLGLGVLLWGAAVWFSMRLVARFTPGLPAPAAGASSVAEGNAAWLPREAPRLAGCFAVLCVATLGALWMSARASLAMALFMGLGALVMHEAVSSLLSALANRSGLLKPGHRIEGKRWRRPVAVLTAVAMAVAWLAVGADPVPVLDGFGWYQVPSGVWRWHADKIGTQTLQLAALFLVSALAYGLGIRAGRSALGRAALSMLAGACWWLGAVLADAQWAVVVFGIVLAVAAAGLWYVVERRHFDWDLIRAFRGLLHAMGFASFAPAVLNPLQEVSRLLMVGAAAAVLVFSTNPLLPGWSLGTLGIAFAALAMWSVVLTWAFVDLPQRAGLGNWALVPLVWVLLVGAPANHSLRTAALPNAESPTPSPAAMPALPTLHQHVVSWRSGLPDVAQSPVFLVAAAGGGLRAAYWTATLLAAMDDRSCGAFGDQVLAVSGVSGGSLGLAAYLAQRQVWAAKPAAQRCQTGRADEMRRLLQRDFLGPVAGSLLFAEAVQAFVPFTYLQRERGNTLADAIDHAWRDTMPGPFAGLLQQPFLQTFGMVPSGTPGHRQPAVYLNATGVESGRRVVASNVQLGAMLADPLFYQSGISRAARLQTADLSVVDAVVNSARFPGISPPGRVWGCVAGMAANRAGQDVCHGNGHGIWGHVVDGGFFENSGLETLMDVWRDLQASPLQGKPGSGLPPVFVVAISNDASSPRECPGTTPRYPLHGQPPTALPQGFDMASAVLRRAMAEPSGLHAGGSGGSDIAAPLGTLLSVREGRANLELRRVVESLGCSRTLEWNLAQVMQQSKAPPLGWLLSKASVQAMDRGVATYADALPFDTAWCAQPGRASRGLLGRLPAQGASAPACPAVAARPGPLLPGPSRAGAPAR